MKKQISMLILTLASGLGFAQDAPLIHADTMPMLIEAKPTLPSLEKRTTSKSFGYVLVAATDSSVPSKTTVDTVIPGLGAGYRYVFGATALDVSASLNSRDIRKPEGKERAFAYTAPKANFLYYITPAKNNSFYAGAGAAFGGNRTDAENEFHGFIPNVTVGFEMNRNNKWRTFVQAEVNKAALAVSKAGELPKTAAEIVLGTGF
jgi:hypothetical protein